MSAPTLTFAVHNGEAASIAYSVRLLRDLYVEDGQPEEIHYHKGEVIALDAMDTVEALAEGWGELVGEIVDGIRCRRIA